MRGREREREGNGGREMAKVDYLERQIDNYIILNCRRVFRNFNSRRRLLNPLPHAPITNDSISQ